MDTTEDMASPMVREIIEYAAEPGAADEPSAHVSLRFNLLLSASPLLPPSIMRLASKSDEELDRIKGVKLRGADFYALGMLAVCGVIWRFCGFLWALAALLFLGWLMDDGYIEGDEYAIAVAESPMKDDLIRASTEAAYQSEKAARWYAILQAEGRRLRRMDVTIMEALRDLSRIDASSARAING
jgi:hypothetical protein